ncbi:MAG: YdbL family protein [Wenzhouxiangellaceae bacterium]|nr:YdbL family protein [Wenzhouxiangellaceae bacterium]
MKPRIKSIAATVVLAALVACVTINVYFPEAAAEEAADRFIKDVIGPEEQPEEVSPVEPSPARSGAFGHVVDFFVPSAHAQSADQSADIDVETPQINVIKQRMAQRHRQYLEAWYQAGAIGLNNDGLVSIIDRSAVGLAERRKLEQVVAEENADRRAVYREIAIANGHPEWEERIRQTFAERWIANARPGWYYQDEQGNWQRK